MADMQDELLAQFQVSFLIFLNLNFVYVNSVFTF